MPAPEDHSRVVDALSAAHQPALVSEGEVPGGPSRTIGEVLAQLRPTFPELTISKIRFYEAQGLLNPQRTASGYRKFSGDDVARLRYILTAARDHYLPLKVIRAQLEALDRGETPAAAAQHGLAAAEEADDGLGTSAPDADVPAELRPEAFDATPSELRLSRHELLRASGLSGDQLAELEQYGLVTARAGSTYFDGDALLVAKIVAQISRYGLEARHLRPVKAAVDREVGLIEQVLTPLLRQPSREGPGRAEQHARGYAALSVRLHVALLEAALRAALR